MLTKSSKRGEILIFCMIFAGMSVSAQQINLKPFASKGFNLNISSHYSPLRSNTFAQQPLPPDFYVKNLGFFCKQELKFEAATKIPLKFRIGSVASCDWMEGKRNAGIFPAP